MPDYATLGDERVIPLFREVLISKSIPRFRRGPIVHQRTPLTPKSVQHEAKAAKKHT